MEVSVKTFTDKIVDQKDLRLVNDSMIYIYNGDPFVINITGGSGDGALIYQIIPITGKCTKQSQSGTTYKVSFDEPGRVWISVYREKSKYQGVNYSRSKTLIMELELRENQVKVSVVNDINLVVGQPLPSPSSAGVEVEPSTSVLSNTPELYFVYQSPDRFPNTSEKQDQININEPGIYTIAARNASVKSSYSRKYSPTIQYRSKKLIYSKDQSYHVSVRYSKKGYLTASSYSTLPDTVVYIEVHANNGHYFDGINGLYAQRLNGSGYCELTKVGAEETKSISGNSVIISGRYSFVMPACDVVVSCSFLSIHGSSYVDPSSWVNPYYDVGVGGYQVNLLSSYSGYEYEEALKFCYFAKLYYVGQNDPIIYNQKFVGSRPILYDFLGGRRVHALTRREAVESFRRIARMNQSYPKPSVVNNPVIGGQGLYGAYVTDAADIDSTFLQNSKEMNTPLSTVFSYARKHEAELEDIDYILELDSKYITNTPEITFGDAVFDTLTSTSLLMPQISNNASTSQGAANDDMLMNYLDFPWPASIAWAGWIGVTYGYNDIDFGPNTFITFQEVSAMFYRYAKYRQIDISQMGDEDTSFLNTSRFDSWTDSGPMSWLISNGIIAPYHVVYTDEGTRYGLSGSQQIHVQPTDKVDKVEFAYMLQKFCEMFAW